MDHLKRQCEPHLVETVKGSVEALCSKIYHLSVEHVKKIRERHIQLLKENGLHDPAPVLPPSLRKEELCSAIQFALPPIRLPVVDYQFERDHINVKYTHPSSQQPDTHTLNMTHLQKLVCAFFFAVANYFNFFNNYRNNFIAIIVMTIFLSSFRAYFACLKDTRHFWAIIRHINRRMK